MPDQKKPKRVNVELIARASTDDGSVRQVYQIMEDLIRKHHPHLIDANIALAWRFGWSADDDGICKLGQARKASDLDREFHEYDFIILLNSEAWNSADFTEAQMRALLDHELCHCQVKVGEDGEPIEDERGRTVYRMRKHDVEEFREIVARHGLWKRDLETFAQAAIDAADKPLLPKSGGVRLAFDPPQDQVAESA